MIGLVTDSASQLPPALADRFGVGVVAVTVTIDGVDHLEGIDLTADGFYQHLASSPELPSISTAQPSARAFATEFERQIRNGADQILAVLVGSAYSGATNSAEVAAGSVGRTHPGIRIEVVDSGTASFGISCAVWAASDTLHAGGDLAEAARAATERAANTGSAFLIDGTDLARTSGRFGNVDLGSAIPVLASGPEGLRSIGEVASIDQGVELMATELLARAPEVVVAIGRAAPETNPITDALIERLRSAPGVRELVEYRVGPSIAAHTGPNTVGGFSFSVD